MAFEKQLEGIDRQLEFIDWLKSKGIYNSMETGHVMQKMYVVWQKMKEETSNGTT